MKNVFVFFLVLLTVVMVAMTYMETVVRKSYRQFYSENDGGADFVDSGDTTEFDEKNDKVIDLNGDELDFGVDEVRIDTM